MIAGTSPPLKTEHCQREKRVAGTFLGCDFVPLRRLNIVATDAETLRIHLAQQDHGGRIVLLCALGRFVELREVKPGLNGTVRNVNVGLVRCIRGRLWRRVFGDLCERAWRNQCGHQNRAKREAATVLPHAAGPGNRSVRPASAMTEAIAASSRQTNSPSATKSAPASESGAISSSDAAYPTDGISNTSAHQRTRSSIADNDGRLPAPSGSPNMTLPAPRSAP